MAGSTPAGTTKIYFQITTKEGGQVAQIPTKEELEDFALNFDEKIAKKLVSAGYDEDNIFSILNLSHQELKHSDFLAYLFNPNKSRYIGQQFLRKFLLQLAKEKKDELKASETKLDVLDILYGSIENVNVYREFAVENGRIDILIELIITNNKPQKIVVAIENKVGSGLHDNQLKTYNNYLNRKKYNDYEKIRLYLTIDESNPDCAGWVPIDYRFIYDTLKNINFENVDNSIQILIDDYKKIIRSEFMDKSKSKEAALEIYEKNRKILDFIFECRNDWVSTTSEVLCELLENKGATIVTVTSKGEIKKTDKRNYANLAFTVKELEKYPTHYFQIYVKDLLLVFRKDLTHNQCGQKWLFVNEKQSHDEVEKYQNLATSDIPQLKKECQQLIDQMFAENGVINECLATLRK